MSNKYKRIMVNSFKFCTFNIAVGGSRHSRIRCFKKGDTCEAGNEQIKMQLLTVLDEPSLSNPFMEIYDSDTEEVYEMNIRDNDSDPDSDINVEDK